MLLQTFWELCKCLWVFPHLSFSLTVSPVLSDLILCLSHLSPSLLFHPSPFISHQQPLTARQRFKCQFLLYFRKTCNYHFSLSDFPLCFVSSGIDVCPFRAALHKLTCCTHSFDGKRFDVLLCRIYCICKCNHVSSQDSDECCQLYCILSKNVYCTCTFLYIHRVCVCVVQEP